MNHTESTLARGNEIEADFFELKSQEIGPRATKAQIVAVVEAALRAFDYATEKLGLPAIGVVWKSKANVRFIVLDVVNADGAIQNMFPRTIVYQNIANGKRYARRLDEWLKEMVPE